MPRRIQLNRAILLVSMAALGQFVVSCAGSGTLDISTRGLDASLALQLLSEPSKPENIRSCLDQLDRNLAPAFDWELFWRGVRENRVTATLSESDQNRLLKNAYRNCGAREFGSFVELALESRMGADLLLSNENPCSVRLGPEKTLKALNLADPASGEELKASAKFILAQYAADPAAEWSPVLASYSDRKWAEVADHLLEAGDTGAVSGLASLHETVRGDASAIMGETVAASILDESALDLGVRRIGLERFLKQALAGSALRKMDQSLTRLAGNSVIAAKQRFLARLSRRLLDELKRDRSGERDFYSAWGQLLMLRRLEQRVSSDLSRNGSTVPLSQRLSWLEDLHRGFEQELRSLGKGASDALEAAATPSLDRVWLRLRLAGSAAEPVRSFDDLASPDPVDQVLGARVAAHLAKDPAARRRKIRDFCALLEKNSIPVLSITDSDSLIRWLREPSPGCVRFEMGLSFERTPVALQLDRVRMPFDSALIAPDSDIALTATSFEGSMMDMSPEWVWPPIPAISHPDPDADGIAFPVILGLQLSRAHGLNKPGVHYFVFHLPVREPKTGVPHPFQSKDGARGGVLRLSVKKGHESSAPVFVSLGGAAQTPGPAVPGGIPSQSSIDVFAAANLINGMDPAGALAAKGEKPVFHANPGVETIRTLVNQAAKSDSGNPKLFFFGPEYLSILSGDQREKVERFCANAGGPEGASLSKCFSQLIAPRSWKLLSGLKTSGAGMPAELLLPEMTQKPGEPGPLNPEGSPGQSGLIEWENP